MARDKLKKKLSDAIYYKKHKQIILAKNKEYRIKNKEKVNKKKAEYRKNHRKELSKYQIQYQKTHKKSVNKKNSIWKKKNKDKVNFYTRQRYYCKRGAGGKHTIKEWEGLREKYNYMCLCCKQQEPEIALTEDHIIPISKWKKWEENHPEIDYKCNDIQNIQPLCISCNASKGNKLI